MKHDAKTLILAAVAHAGLAPTAQKLGTSRTGLASYLTGTAREGTALLIEGNVDRLAADLPGRAA